MLKRWFILGTLCLVGCSSQQKTNTLFSVPSSASVLAYYHVLTWSAKNQTMTGLARVITPRSQQTAPPMTVNGKQVTMTARTNPDAKAFPVTVWEAEVPIGQTAKVAGQTLPAVNTNPQNITVLGDTGAYGWQKKNATGWPFPTMIQTLSQASTLPDLVIHVGDYNYRGTPHHSPKRSSPDVYDACGTKFQRQDTKGMRWGDDWPTWKADFFDPAQGLLATAPWVMTRGNHELCSRAGMGWFYLLDPGSTLLDSNYQVNPCQNQNTFASPVYALTFQNLQLVLIDSANICDNRVEHQQKSTFTPHFQHALALAKAQSVDSWLITHKPLFSYHTTKANPKGSNPPKVSTYVCKTMDAILGQSSTKAWYQDFSMFIAGHVHDFQFVKPSKAGWPSLFVVGNGGVALSDSKLNGPVAAHFYLASGHFQTTGSAYIRFGYLTLKETQSQWKGTLFDPNGSSIDHFIP